MAHDKKTNPFGIALVVMVIILFSMILYSVYIDHKRATESKYLATDEYWLNRKEQGISKC